MNSIGIRCTPHQIFYTVLNFENEEFSTLNQVLVIPKSFDKPNKLKYIRKTFLDIFKEYNIITAGIRVTEHNAPSVDLFRIMLEAVIQELIASSNVEYYFTGVISSISSKLGIPNDGQFKFIIDGTNSFLEINDWNTFSKEHRECILVGYASNNR